MIYRGDMKHNNENKSFKEVLAEIESPQDWGNGSWSLPENPTSLERAKYELCKQILTYKQDNNLSTEEIAQKINLTNSETQDIIFYHIDYFTLDRLMTYAEKIFSPNKIKIIVESRARTV
jgi:predicted XRE-type DNA-binding protein